jgi:hypothetical protein
MFPCKTENDTNRGSVQKRTGLRTGAEVLMVGRKSELRPDHCCCCEVLRPEAEHRPSSEPLAEAFPPIPR